MKRIVILADGTWNSPDDGESTNVLRLARAIKPREQGVEQVAFYDWGVGTDRKKITGGLSADGLDKNIQDGYRFLIHNYDPGDQLFFFGFSRGAYTVRSLAGLIRNCGLLRRQFADQIDDAYKLYRKRGKNSHPDAEDSRRFRENYAVDDLTHIDFVGVWDTVGALGVPISALEWLNSTRYEFHDTEPSKIIRRARHALSIDESRHDFSPTLWDPKPGLDLKQVWFAGVHSDVGGGYKARGLSDCAFDWMLGEARAAGLALEPYLSGEVRKNPFARQHNEYKGLYRLRGEKVREIQPPVHVSVKERWDDDSQHYRTRSRPLAALLDSVGGDWSQIPLER